MSATVPDEVLAAGDTPPDGRSSWRTVRTMLAWLLSFAALAVVVGFLSGVFWWGVVDLPTYTIGEDFRGYTTERAITRGLLDGRLVRRPGTDHRSWRGATSRGAGSATSGGR